MFKEKSDPQEAEPHHYENEDMQDDENSGEQYQIGEEIVSLTVHRNKT